MRKAVLVICIVYAVLRLVLHVGMLVGWIPGGEESWLGTDLVINLEAARDLDAREDLYVLGKMEILELFHYSPLYAIATIPASRLSFTAAALWHTLITCLAYVALYLMWRHMFHRWGLVGPQRALHALLPLWLIYGAFWGDLGFLNIYTALSLLATVLIYAVVEERLGLAVLAAFLILQAKPQWAFALAVPLILRRDRFFRRLAGWTLVAYIAAALLTIVALGWEYGLRQYANYYQFLLGMTANFRWRGPEVSLGYNHSLMQIAYHLFGINPTIGRGVIVLKVAILLPLSWLAWRLAASRLGQREQSPLLALDVAWAFYLAAFIWLDVVWELTLAIAIYTYVMPYIKRRWVRVAVSVPFLFYAAQDVYLVIIYALSSENPTLNYFAADIATHVPVIMIVLLAFYGVILARLAGWLRPAAHGS